MGPCETSQDEDIGFFSLACALLHVISMPFSRQKSEFSCRDSRKVALVSTVPSTNCSDTWKSIQAHTGRLKNSTTWKII